MSKYSIGIDFGTLSGRAIVVDIETGNEIVTSVCEYKHGVMSEFFLNGTSLPPDYALQHPQDYIDVLCSVLNDCISRAKISADDIVGIGVDFTASTVMPVTEDGTPLCFLDEYKENPHAYVKLWKHHAAQKEADEINNLAKSTGAKWLSRYGGIISSEWLFPKVLQILREDKSVYDKTFRFIEAGDWIVWYLTGVETHSICTTGFKALWDEENGYPDKDFLSKLAPEFESIVGTKISIDVTTLLKPAGVVTERAASLTGLKVGIPVMPALIDAHAALPALGVVSPGELLMIIGTSTCHIMMGDKAVNVPGISGCVKDGIIDGLYAYEAGQSCVGDSFDWFVKNCVPKSYFEDADKLNLNIYQYLSEKAKLLFPGSNGLLALDWWNGNRTPYVDGNLTGTIVGLDIHTLPEEIYRALIESTAYGTKRIIEIYEENGIKIDKLYAAGGIAEKDALLMQIYADVTEREIYLSGTSQACAYGSAVLGAVNKNGYTDIKTASKNMKKVKDVVYKPNSSNSGVYKKLYEKYKILSEFFAENDIMKMLKSLN